MIEPSTIVYRIDARDNIIFVNDAWHDFAVSNEASDYTVERVINRSLWSFISDHTTRQFYRAALKKVRNGTAMSFDFRCDSPETKRMMRMHLTLNRGDVQFRSETVVLESRPPIELLARNSSRSNNIVVVCGWCKRIRLSEFVWREIEQAAGILAKLSANSSPSLSHGICETCKTEYFGLLEKV